MKKFCLPVLLFFIISFNGIAQGTSGQSGTGANMDIKHHRFEWSINPDQSKRISGNVTTWFVTTEDNVNSLSFDFYKSSFDNSNLVVKYHGNTVTHSFPSSGNENVLNISLPASLVKGTLDSVTVFYDGVPPNHTGTLPVGCKQAVAYSGGPQLFYTLSESYEDKDWWPCKADMQDKIDSLTFVITVPAKYAPIANGMLESVETSGADRIFTFKHQYPIASYLVGIAVSEYEYYPRGTVDINGTQVPVEYYIAKGRASNTTVLNVMDQCKQELVVFSNLFGDYPYKNEQYGMYEFLFSGGMEHQTMSGMSYNAMRNWSVVAHELMHQWFGDKVTMSTWNHLWLSEAFASYGEVLAAEFVPSIGADPVAVRLSKKNSANNASQRLYGSYIPNSFITNSSTLWNSQYGNTVYTRGGMIVSMLRTLMGDEKFFSACRNYLNDPALAYSSATTGDLKAHLEAELDGFDLTGFFDSFVYGNGYPNYGKDGSGNSVKWQAVGSDSIRFRIDAPAKSTGSDVDTYYSVIPLRVQGANGEDTLIVLYDQGTTGVSVGGDGIVFGNSPTPQVYLGFIPVTVTFDPYNLSLANGVTVQTSVMPVSILSFSVAGTQRGNMVYLKLAAETGFQQVVLERSTDGINFREAGSMEATADGEYAYLDQDTNWSYYRAKLIQTTGEVSYSKVVRVLNTKDERFSIVTNPVQNFIRIKVPAEAFGETLRFNIFDALGRRVFTEKKKILNREVQLSTGIPANGTYILHIQSDSYQTSLKFMVNR